MANIIRENFPRVREVKKQGTSYWVCDSRSAKLYPDGKEEWFSTQTAALERHNEIREQLTTGTIVSPTELAFLREWKTKYAALPDMKPDSIIFEMEKALNRYHDNWNKREDEKDKKPTIAELCEQWVEAKHRGDYRKLRISTLKEIESTAKLITSQWGSNVYDSLKKHHISDFLESLTDAHLTTKRKWRVRIGGFCQWCIDTGKGRANPAKNIKVASTIRETPEKMTIEQVKTLLETCQRDKRFNPLIKFIAIGLFAGLRPHEIHRLKPEDIQLEETPYFIERYKSVGMIHGVIDVKSTTAKTGRPRKVVINETLARFLIKYKDQPIYPGVNFRRLFDSLRVNANFDKWPNDFIRHTSASYFVGRTQDWPLTAAQFGNSVEVLASYYVDVVNPKIVEEFYSIRPVD